MAGTNRRVRVTGYQGSDVHAHSLAINQLIDDMDAVRGALQLVMPGVVLSAPALKAGTTADEALRSEAFTFTFRGKITSAAAAETALTATTHDVAASKEAWFVLSVQTNGTSFTITKGADQTIGTVVLPTAPDNEIIVGYMGIVTGGGGAFDATTDALAVAGNIAAITFTDANAVGSALFTAQKLANGMGEAITE